MPKETKLSSEQPFAFKLIEPYKTFHNGIPKRIPYVIDGLLTQGGLSALGGKSKYGKSSFSRYEAVSVVKGKPFLGRDTTQGEVILLNLEDPLNHVDNCLSVLGYDPRTDARIRIVEKLAPTAKENIEALGDVLTKLPDVRLVIIDTLAKFIRVEDLNDYMPVLTAVEQLHDLARKFPHLHIQGTAHCKKIKTDDPFDGLLGSTALRGEPDTNLAIYGEGGQRVLSTETRIGRNIPPTLLRADLAESAGANVVSNFSLDMPWSDWQKAQMDKSEHKRKLSHEERIITYLQNRVNLTATQSLTLDEVEGKNTYKLAAIQTLIEAGVVIVTGKKQSPTDPLTLQLNQSSLRLHDFINRFDGRIQ
jgi:hypothetical protein